MAISQLQLTPQFVQAVRDAVDVVEVASGYTKLARAGRKWKGLCPLHKEKTPSFHVDPELGFFKCFGCGAGGDAIKLHMQLTGDDFPAAMEALARRFGVPMPAPAAAHRGSRGRGPVTERDPEEVLEGAAEWFRDQLARAPEIAAYLERRKIPRELVERYGLGFAPEGWRNLLGAMAGKATPGDLIAVGLAARPDGGGEPYDRFRNRLIFPIRNAAGRLVGFGGRTMGDDVAKYVNTAETDRFRKSLLLYGLDQAKRAIRDASRVFLVEGYVDVLAAVASGVEGAVASMGTALTPEQARLAARFADEVVLGYDGDEAGETACRRALPILLGQGLAVRRARMPAGGDPDSLRLEQGERALRAAIEEADDLVLGELERLAPADLHRNPAARSRAGKEITELLKPIPDAIVRYGYARAAADRLGVPVQLVWQRLGGGREALAEALGSGREGPTPGRRAEEELLRALLLAADRGEDLPPLGALPPAAAFLDPDLRKFFAGFSRLYGSGGDLSLRSVLAAAEGVADAEEKAAQLLLESEDSSVPPIADGTRNLRRRWLRSRLQEINRELSESEQRGDRERVAALVAEKQEINGELHGLAPRDPDLE